MATTRKDLRWMIGARIPGEQALELTATSAGSTTAFNDTENLQGPNDAYKGMSLWFTSGTNKGSQRYVQSSVQSTGQLNWGAAVAAAVAAGDTAELWNQRGMGVKATEVNDAINHALLTFRRGVWAPRSETISTAFDRTSPSVPVPTALTRGVYAVRWQDTVDTAVWHEVWGGGEVPTAGWWYDGASHAVVIGEPWATEVDQRTLRLDGYGDPELLYDDADATPLDPEAVVTEAVYHLLKRNSVRNPDLLGFLKDAYAEKERARPFAVGRKLPTTVVFD